MEKEINAFIFNESCSVNYNGKKQITKTAETLSKELLYMKFLQGIPIVGIVKRVYDAVYMKQINRYADLKYQRSFLNR